MSQLRNRRSGVRGISRGLSLPPLLAFVLLAGAARAGEIRGRLLVSDRADRPAGGLTISAVPWETPGDEARRAVKGGEAPKPIASATSAADGSFVLSVPPAEPGREKISDRLFRVRAEGAGIVPVLFEGVYDAAENEDLGEHILPHGEKLSGIAVDTSGKPLAGAVVSLEPGVAGGDDLAYRVVTRTAVTGEDGTFKFEEASATGNRITIEKTGLAPKLQTGLRSGAVPRPVTVGPGDPVAGVIFTANKKPAAGALVRLESPKATTRWVETDAEGHFAIPHAPDGRGTIVVDAGEAGWGSRPDVKLPLGEGRSVTITLALPASLDGKVVDDRTGRVVPRAKVFVKANGFARLARTGPDGLYHLKGIPPQTYRLSVDEPRYVSWVKADLPLVPGESRRFDVAITLGATMIGKVVDENGGPVSAARGTLVRGGENALQGIRRMIRVAGETTAFRTRADGTFKATRLAPGDNQRLFVSHADFERATLAGLSLPSGGTKGDVAIVMRRGATISGIVKDANDQPISDVEVQVDPSVNFRAGAGGMVANFVRLGGPSLRPKTKTAADGAFHITGMSPGEYALQVKKSGFANERVDPVKVTDKGADPVVVTLGPGASITGIVRKKNGEGAEGYMVRVGAGGRGMAGAGGPMAGTGADMATGPDGLFVIDGLKPGQVYDLSVFGGVGLGPQKRGVVAPAANVDLVVAGTGRIAGTAVDAKSGQPLKNFTVSYEPDRGGGGVVIRLVARGAGAQTGIGQKRDVKSDDGAFALEDVPAGTWTVVVESKGYQEARVSNLVVEENGSKDQVEVRVTPGVVLKGRVTDARTGRPVANASITHQPAGGGGGGGFGGFGGRGGPLGALEGGDDVSTDAEGNFEIEGIGVGRLKVTAKNPDYTDGSEVADVKETGGTVEIKLTSGGSASGVVVNGSQPLPNAEVALSAAGDTGFGRILGGSQTTISDAAGRFHFDHLGTGRYSVSAGLSGKSSNVSEFVLQAGDSKSDLVLSLSSGSTIEGIVSGLPDTMRTGATVMVTGVQSFFANTKVGADGSFSVSGVPAGPVTLRAQAGDGLGTSRSATKEVTASDDVPVLQTEIVFEVGFTLSGRVLRAGQPVANAMVVANLQGGGGRQATARTDDGGSYALQGLQEGSYTITAMGDPLSGGASQVRQTISLTNDQSLDLTFPLAKVAGVVTDADTKQPLADASVSLAAAEGTGSVPMRRMTTTDSNGHFQFADIIPQAYTLNSQKTDYQFDKRSLTAADDGSTESLLIELARGQGIGIVVKDGIYGVPMRSVMARVLDGTKSAVFIGAIALDTTGAGEIPSLKPGGYSVFVNASGYATVYLQSVSAPSQQPVPVTLTPGGTADVTVGAKSFVSGILRGTLKTASGVPYPYTLFNLDGRIAITADATGQTGRHQFTNLAPGSYILTLDNGGGTTFNISEGGVTPVPLP